MVEELTKHEKACLADLNRAWNQSSKEVKGIFVDYIVDLFLGEDKLPKKTKKQKKATT
jgi:hypothetical protein